MKFDAFGHSRPRSSCLDRKTYRSLRVNVGVDYEHPRRIDDTVVQGVAPAAVPSDTQFGTADTYNGKHLRALDHRRAARALIWTASRVR